MIEKKDIKTNSNVRLGRWAEQIRIDEAEETKNLILLILESSEKECNLVRLQNIAFLDYLTKMKESHRVDRFDNMIALPFGPARSDFNDAFRIVMNSNSTDNNKVAVTEIYTKAIEYKNGIFMAKEALSEYVYNGWTVDMVKESIKKLDSMPQKTLDSIFYINEWRRALKNPKSKIMDDLKIAEEKGLDGDAINDMEEQREDCRYFREVLHL